jgi:hypothetical protein
MIQKINNRLNEYLEFDNSILFFDPMIRIFGGAIRDSIADETINDIDILCGAQSLRRLESILEQNGYHHFEKLTSVDITNLYSTIHVISEPRTWIKGTKVVQLIRPRLQNIDGRTTQSEKQNYSDNFKNLIENVDFSCCGISWSNGVLYENCESAILHCLNKQYCENQGAQMYSYERAQHRRAKLESRGWESVSRNRVQRRDLKIDFILENKEEFEFTKEWSDKEPLMKSQDPPGMFSNVVGRGKVWQ